MPFALRARPATVRVPYLRFAPAVLPAATVAICYAAGDWDKSRSVPPASLAPLVAGRPAITLVTEPSDLPVLNPEGCPPDIGATAALVAGAALVITVDTMIAHLAGALGTPTWLLLKHEPDWRWPVTGTRTAWYPAMRLYRQQSPGDWQGVVDRVATDLASRDADLSRQRGQR